METLGVQLLVMKMVGLVTTVQLGRGRSTACRGQLLTLRGCLLHLGQVTGCVVVWFCMIVCVVVCVCDYVVLYGCVFV